jgi:hypothetical protein
MRLILAAKMFLKDCRNCVSRSFICTYRSNYIILIIFSSLLQKNPIIIRNYYDIFDIFDIYLQ